MAVDVLPWILNFDLPDFTLKLHVNAIINGSQSALCDIIYKKSNDIDSHYPAPEEEESSSESGSSP